MILDAHAHVGSSVYGLNQTPDALIKTMAECGVDKAVVMPFTPPRLNFKAENSRIARTVQQHRGRLVGFAAVDPRFGDEAASEVERAIRELRLLGVKLNPFEQGFQVNDALVYPVMRKASELGVPVLIESGHPVVSNPLQVGDLAEAFPDVTIIMSHGGQLLASGQSAQDALTVVAENASLIVETSGVILTGKDGFIEEIVKTVGCERLVFGSNAPLMHPRVELARVRTAKISNQDKERILGENMNRILRIRP